VRQRQQAVRVCAVRLWPFVPSSECGAASVLICVAVATSIARLSPGRVGTGGRLLMMLGLGCWCGGIDTHGHHQLLFADGTGPKGTRQRDRCQIGGTTLLIRAAHLHRSRARYGCWCFNNDAPAARRASAHGK
jgi:hypothetical protein